MEHLLNGKYEAVIGLEVHAQLITSSKAFSSDKNEYGSAPNTNVSEISLGLPGTLPQFNSHVLRHAIKLGIACGSEIRHEITFDRKNYFYADLPKGYQITQDGGPICTGGTIDIKTEAGEKSIRITRIHMEEDSGKSIHDQDPYNSLVDLNRAGVPLLEIVSEPDIRTGEEAYQYLTEIRKLVRYLEICDGNMEEGSMRCDANISVRLKGAEEYGRRVEVKNMNSIRNVQRAIEYEVQRHIEMIEKGEEIKRETRSFDAVAGTTFGMRSKEMDNDYRYFPEPDLLPVMVNAEDIDHIQENMPALPNELYAKYTKKLELSEYDARVLIDSKEIALYYEDMIEHTKNFKAAANWLTGDIKSHLNKYGIEIAHFPIRARTMADLIELVDSEKVSYSSAAQKIFPALLERPNEKPEKLAQELNLIQESDESALLAMVDEALSAYPDKVEEYRNGKKGLIGLFMGEIMKKSRGKADPKKTNQLLREKLEA
jgi:aspartyl-tRNA(Asn)/glutamyl-tRNA(Gln) amidotransferase subunit B